MKEFKIKQNERDSIVNYLKVMVVPALVGADIVQIINLLSHLEEIKKEEGVNKK